VLAFLHACALSSCRPLACSLFASLYSCYSKSEHTLSFFSVALTHCALAFAFTLTITRSLPLLRVCACLLLLFCYSLSFPVFLSLSCPCALVLCFPLPTSLSIPLRLGIYVTYKLLHNVIQRLMTKSTCVRKWRPNYHVFL